MVTPNILIWWVTRRIKVQLQHAYCIGHFFPLVDTEIEMSYNVLDFISNNYEFMIKVHSWGYKFWSLYYSELADWHRLLCCLVMNNIMTECNIQRLKIGDILNCNMQFVVEIRLMFQPVTSPFSTITFLSFTHVTTYRMKLKDVFLLVLSCWIVLGMTLNIPRKSVLLVFE